jgi:hypothetical protein
LSENDVFARHEQRGFGNIRSHVPDKFTTKITAVVHKMLRPPYHSLEDARDAMTDAAYRDMRPFVTDE